MLEPVVLRQVRNYREIIQEHLANRIAFNARYSLRALARDFGMSPGQLSLVLSGKRGISTKRAEAIFAKIGLNESEIETCLLQVEKEHARSKKARVKAESELLALTESQGKHAQLTLDAFQVISEWYHFAIIQSLSLREVRSLKSTANQIRWLSARLGIHETETRSAIERLRRIELIAEKAGIFRVLHETVFSSDGVPSSGLRKFHSQVLLKALSAIESQSIDERYLNSIMLPIRKSDLPAIKADILKSQKTILKKYGRVNHEDGETVYALSQQLFRITEDLK